jgi:glycosidase
MPEPDTGRPANPALYQLNTRVHLTERARTLGRATTLDDIADEELDRIAGLGFDWLWLLSVWSTGPAGRQVALDDPGLRREFEATLPDLRDEDVGGSGFAITAYEVSPALGGDEALARLRARMAARGLRLMLDFVPNHVAIDCPWVETHLDYFVRGSELDLVREPRNYTWVRRAGEDVPLAHGRDPYFPGWTDTLQLDYSNPDLCEAMTEALIAVARRCDGVRCDMAMLLLPDVFARTWGRFAQPFWAPAIERVREAVPGFVLMAEVYWDLEWTMLQLGFDYAYDKRLYDRLVAGYAGPVRDHLRAGLDYQSHLARFLENHDEPRAAAVFPPDRHEAAALITFLAPGLRFLHDGQLEGHRVHVSPHLVRAPSEPTDQRLAAFYDRLLAIVRTPLVRDGGWRLLECTFAWDGNPTAGNFIAFAWTLDDARLLVVVNFGPTQGQCRVHLAMDDVRGRTIRLEDRIGDLVFLRDGDDLATNGLYVDLPPCGSHVLAFSLASGGVDGGHA